MYERIDYLKDNQLDFRLVTPPRCMGGISHDLVSGYHREFSRCLDELDPRYWVDEILFARYRLYYEKLASLLFPTVPVESLIPESRHRFFVTSGADGEILRLSGLQRLLGYTEIIGTPATGPSGPSGPSTGRPDLDVVASLVLLQVPDVPWLCQRYSVDELSAIAGYIVDVKTGAAGGTTEEQKAQDMALWESVMATDPELEKARLEAQQALLTKHGPIAMSLANLQSQKD
jgi:hypothetical protein